MALIDPRHHRTMSRSRSIVATATVVGGLALAGVTAGPALAASAVTSPVTVSYTDVGEHVFTVPAGVTSIHVVAIGGKGGGGFAPGGLGAHAEGDLKVTPGQTLYTHVGGAGAPGSRTVNARADAGGGVPGGPGGAYSDAQYAASHGYTPLSGGGGGGASDVRTCSISIESCVYSLKSMLLIAAGGGGAGADSAGGAGGTPNGQSAVASKNGARPGTGATTSLWGYGGLSAYLGASGRTGDVSIAGNGGLGASYGGGGGGGGYYGGGGGAAGLAVAGSELAGGGGGGSSYGPAGTQYSTTNDPGALTISYQPATPVTVAARFTAGAAPVARVGKPYSHRFAATGTPTPKIALISGKLPSGLSLADDGTLAGTPRRRGTYRFTLSATNGVGTPGQAGEVVTVR